MHTKAPHEQFYRYVIPAMASQLLTGFFIIVDGFSSAKHRGRRPCLHQHPVAHRGCHPLQGWASAPAAAWMTNAMGAGDTEKALAARGNTLLCLGAATVLRTAALGLSYRWLLRLLGATGEGCTSPRPDYNRCRQLAGGLQIFNSGLNPLLRGSGRTVAAMAIMIFQPAVQHPAWTGCSSPYSAWAYAARGAATVTAQGLSALAALLCLLYEQNAPVHARQFCPDPHLCKNCLRWAFLRLGFPCPPVCAHHAQQLAVHPLRRRGRCCYHHAILSYVLGALQPLLSGIGEGIQPLVSLPRCGRPCGPASFTAPRAAFTAGGGRDAVRRHIPLLGNSCRCCLALRPRPPGESVPALLFAVARAALSWGVNCA